MFYLFIINNVSTDVFSFCFQGNYSCLEAEFTLRRDVAFFMILSYIPSALLVGLSWVNFWLSMDAVPARITLGVLTLLTITTQSVGANKDMPAVNYIKVSIFIIVLKYLILSHSIFNHFDKGWLKL